mmetsp:Transcript_34815/g.84617  ORF Transcript_34815/g.84617 Transcript_34815/m.84617 type:complete len:86 (+) Transcript_34815:724-981(+)
MTQEADMQRLFMPVTTMSTGTAAASSTEDPPRGSGGSRQRTREARLLDEVFGVSASSVGWNGIGLNGDVSQHKVLLSKKADMRLD